MVPPARTGGSGRRGTGSPSRRSSSHDRPTMPRLRLIADDLTGTLDTAAGFTGLCGAIPVAWPEAPSAGATGCLAIDSGTRELSPEAAARIVGGLAPRLRDADIAFKKVDSLLRGPWAAELAAVMRLGAWERCVVAPAFPYQGRRTEGGRQHARRSGGWEPVSGDIAEALRAAGLPARRADPADGPVAGVAVYDAASDGDLARIAATRRRRPGPVVRQRRPRGGPGAGRGGPERPQPRRAGARPVRLGPAGDRGAARRLRRPSPRPVGARPGPRRVDNCAPRPRPGRTGERGAAGGYPPGGRGGADRRGLRGRGRARPEARHAAGRRRRDPARPCVSRSGPSASTSPGRSPRACRDRPCGAGAGTVSRWCRNPAPSERTASGAIYFTATD